MDHVFSKRNKKIDFYKHLIIDRFARLLNLQRRFAITGLCILGPVLATESDASAYTKPIKKNLSTHHIVKKTRTESSESAPTTYAKRPEVQAFIDSLVNKHGFIANELNQVFAHTFYIPTVARLITPVGSTKPKVWRDYRARFIEPTRIQAGLRFWEDHALILAQAEKEYGVPASIIVAILGIETIYGRNLGKFRIIDALSTLSFDYPNTGTNRAPFFRQQLEEYLLLVRDMGWNVFTPSGSYAGAIGMPQFMPSSYRTYAVDFDGDGKIDLRSSSADAIGSVAKFLQQHGWQSGQPTHTYLDNTTHPETLATLAQKGIEPSLSPAELQQEGLTTSGLNVNLRYAVIDLPQGIATPDYVLGTRNFFVITRYNRSSFYAMAVIELAQTIERNRITASSSER